MVKLKEYVLLFITVYLHCVFKLLSVGAAFHHSLVLDVTDRRQFLKYCATTNNFIAKYLTCQ